MRIEISMKIFTEKILKSTFKKSLLNRVREIGNTSRKIKGEKRIYSKNIGQRNKLQKEKLKMKYLKESL